MTCKIHKKSTIYLAFVILVAVMTSIHLVMLLISLPFADLQVEFILKRKSNPNL